MASPSQILYISEDRDPTAYLNSLFQCNVSHDEELFPNICSEFLFMQIVSYHLYILEKTLAPSPLQPSVRYLETAARTPFRIFTSQLNLVLSLTTQQRQIWMRYVTPDPLQRTHSGEMLTEVRGNMFSFT